VLASWWRSRPEADAPAAAPAQSPAAQPAK
jgi:hypothetical protein